MLYSLFEDFLPLLLIIFLSSFINILLHELGHAVPLFFLTKGEISIYVGSYGDSSASLKISIKRLLIYIKYNPLQWIRGQCKAPNENMSINQNILFVACGPLVSVLIAMACWYILKYSNFSGALVFFIGICFALAAVYSFSSLLPFETAGRTYEGKPRKNDINNIIYLLMTKRYYAELQKFDKYIADKKYPEASEIIESLITKGRKDNDIYRRSIAVNSLLGNYNKAQQLVDILFKIGTPISEDYINAGYVKSLSGEHDAAFKFYEEALALDPNQVYALNNIGYTLTCVQNKHNEALEYLNRAIDLNTNFAHAYNNRGYAKLKTGDFKNALSDISHSLKLEDTNAYAYRNLGIYFFDVENFDEAKIQFEKAREIDADIPMLGEYLEKLKL